MNVCTQGTVVVRAAGERTALLCEKLLVKEVSSESVHKIQETPFSRAVIRTLELGIESGLPWTIAVDADVLVTEGAVRKLIEAAEQQPSDTFAMEGRIFDKLFQGPRSGGLHLYRTAMLPQALEIAKLEEITHRPEYHVIKEMARRGFAQQRFDFVLGLHDFEQSYRDLFRKGFVHAQKFSDALSYFLPMWERLARDDDDFRAVLAGVAAGQKVGGIAHTDVRKFGNEVTEILASKRISSEKPDLSGELRPSVSEQLQSMQTADEFMKWESSRAEGRHWSLRVPGVLGNALQALPEPVKRAIRHAFRLPTP